ncbi:MAG: type I restriction enzyme HsdR N-terminal domain-containing protein [Leptolyngbyaceae cyanobacterium]
MVQVLQASQLTLHDVEVRFNLTREKDPNFFPEYLVASPDLTEYQRHTLDQAQSDFEYLARYPVQEELVKMVVLSPLLSVAGFYHHPFRPVAEKVIEIEVETNEEVVRGRIDILVLNEQLWVTLIESKGSQFSWHQGLPQALTYMMSSPVPGSIRFGMITNGLDIVFVKLDRDSGQYNFSKTFSLFNPGNDLYQVVGILKVLSQERR